MTIHELLLYALKHNLFNSYEFTVSAFSVFRKLKKPKKTIVYRTGKEVELFIDDTTRHTLLGTKDNEPVFDSETKYLITPKQLSCLTKDTLLTATEVLGIYVMIQFPFKGKVPYTKHFTIRNFENNILAPLVLLIGTKEQVITMDQYHQFHKGARYLEFFSLIFTVAATPLNIAPPPDIAKTKAKVLKEIGPIDSAVKQHQYEQAMIDHLKEYMKDDPSLGKAVAGKTLNKSMLANFVSIGRMPSFGTLEDETMILNSLMDGAPTDAETQASIINIIYAGSYFRGKMTQLGGVIVSAILRALANISIKEGDCKTTLTKRITITKDREKNYQGLYYIKAGKPTLITVDNSTALLGKPIAVRSPMYCKSKGNTYCEICAGKSLSILKDGVSTSATSVSRTVIGYLLATVHGRTIDSVEIDMNDLIT